MIFPHVHAHDLAVVRHVSDRGIMYLGRLVEYGPYSSILKTRCTLHKDFLSAVPVLGKRTIDSVVLSDEVPSAPSEDFEGCVFAHRCEEAQPASARLRC